MCVCVRAKQNSALQNNDEILQNSKYKVMLKFSLARK